MNPTERDRKRIRTVIVAFVGVLCSLPFVMRMLAEAWHREQLVYQTALALSHAPGITVTLVVLIPAGVVLGLVAVFALDEYKRVQRLVLLASVPVFAVVLYSFDLWTTETLDWRGYWWGLPLGVVGGALLGVVGGSIPRTAEVRRTFPTAARLLYVIVAVAVGVGFLERYVGYSSPLVTQGTEAGGVAVQSPGVPVLAVDFLLPLYLLTSVVLVVVVGMFVSYSNRHGVLVLTPPDDGETHALSLLAGLYAVAHDDSRYEEVEPREGSQLLNETQVVDSISEIPARGEVNSGIGFQFVRTASLSRRRIVEYSGLDLPWDGELDELERRTESRGDTRLLAEATSSRLRDAVPEWVRNRFGQRSNQRVERIDRAETVVIYVPLSDLVATTEEDDGVVFDETQYSEKLERIYDTYRDDPTCDVFFVAAEAEHAMTAFDAEHGYRTLYESREFADFVSQEVLGVPYADDVIPVTHGDDHGTDRCGFKRVLDRL